MACVEMVCVEIVCRSLYCPPCCASHARSRIAVAFPILSPAKAIPARFSAPPFSCPRASSPRFRASRCGSHRRSEVKRIVDKEPIKLTGYRLSGPGPMERQATRQYSDSAVQCRKSVGAGSKARPVFLHDFPHEDTRTAHRPPRALRNGPRFYVGIHAIPCN